MKRKTLGQMFKVVDGSNYSLYECLAALDELLGWKQKGEVEDDWYMAGMRNIEDDLFTVYWNTEHTEDESLAFAKNARNGAKSFNGSQRYDVKSFVWHIRFLLSRGIIEPRRKVAKQFVK